MSNLIAERIQARLAATGKSAAAASIEAGLGRSAIQSILSGASESPRVITLSKLAPVLDCSLEYLLGIFSEPDRDFQPAPKLSRHAPVITDVLHIAAADVFRRRNAYEITDDETTIVYRDSRYPFYRVLACRIDDGSMTEAGIQKDDIIHITSNTDEDYRLKSGQVVLVERVVFNLALYELSLRQIVFRDKAISFECRPAADLPIDAFSIELGASPLTGHEGVANVHPLKDGSGFIRVWGVALRLVRRLNSTIDPD